jgi:PRC-barrel domain protein
MEAEPQPDQTNENNEPAERPIDQGSPESGWTVSHRDFAEWHGKALIDQNNETIGKLEDVYFDVETDQPQFATIKEGLFGRHLTFVPLTDVIIGPDNLQVATTKARVNDAPNIELTGDDLSGEDESTLYHYYHLNYTPSATPSGRRLARR